ncbi:MAG: SET domain-containing protein-lysine N-methyltransferase [Chlamydiales bacterium]|nr:SET domain-containing protein-lysine N-methyltransferase [Chlamydiales bacterium]
MSTANPHIFSVDHGKGPCPYTRADFERVFNIRYLDALEFNDWRTESYIRKKCAQAHRKGNIESLAIWLGKLHGKSMEEGAGIDVTIKWIDERIGYGLFTNQKLKKWQYVGEYVGLLRRRNLIFRNVNDYCFQYPREWRTTKAFTIDSEDQGNYTRFINHSDTPNVESLSFFHDGVFRIGFRAIEEIAAGTELTYDYGEIYWNNRKKL